MDMAEFVIRSLIKEGIAAYRRREKRLDDERRKATKPNDPQFVSVTVCGHCGKAWTPGHGCRARR